MVTFRIFQNKILSLSITSWYLNENSLVFVTNKISFIFIFLLVLIKVLFDKVKVSKNSHECKLDKIC